MADSSQKNVNIPDVVTGMQMLTVNRQEDNDPNFIIKRTLRRRTIQTSYDDTGLDRLNRRYIKYIIFIKNFEQPKGNS